MWACRVLGGSFSPTTPPTGTKPVEPTAATMLMHRPKSIHDGADAPLKERNIADKQE
jgi:hypothetical protein